MKLKLLLFYLGLFLAATYTTANTVIAQQTSVNLGSSQLVAQPKSKLQIVSKDTRNKEQSAFFASKYDYWDARVLADYWGQSVGDAKARMGRKILWGQADVAILEQFLVDARTKALQSNSSNTVIKFYEESTYTYKDASKLAKFWGDRSPWDAKLRIGRNLILGQDKIVERAMQQANRSD